VLAACLNGQGDIELKTFAKPTADPHGVVVEMHFASVCGSDVHIVFDGLHAPSLLGKAGYPGHESVGIVVESRSDKFPVGTRVLTVPLGAAGGCFARYQAVSENQLLPIPDGVELATALMAQQLGTTIFALKKFLPRDRAAKVGTAAIIGAGSAGLFFLQQLVQAGIKVMVSDLDPSRLAIAGRLGADRVILSGEESLTEAAAEYTSGQGVDLVIEAAGYDSCRAEALEIVRSGGHVGFFGYAERKGMSPFPVHLAFRKSITVEWISGAQSEPELASFRSALEMIASNGIEVGYCLQAMYALEQLADALAAARAYGRGAAKIGVDIAGKFLPTASTASCPVVRTHC
jgi:L-iditol 2-dehydrogenase